MMKVESSVFYDHFQHLFAQQHKMFYKVNQHKVTASQYNNNKN